MKIESFGWIGEREVHRYTMEGDGVSVSVLDFGATVQSIVVDGVDVVLGFPQAVDYQKNGGYVCGTIGRVANRIGGARFTLGGREYVLSANERGNQLHGGKIGFHHKFWDATVSGNSVTMRCESPDGEDGYPGKLTMTVRFTLTGRIFNLAYSAVSDRDTIWAPTTHFYFNMNGEVGNAVSNELTLYADGYTPVDPELIPLGSVADVEGTPFDFRKPTRIDSRLDQVGGYDHNFVLTGSHAATLRGDRTDLRMEMYTDMPCIQLYSGNGNMGGVQGKLKPYFAREGIALEPQFAPNAINMEGFEKPILPANETRSHYITLVFD